MKFEPLYKKLLSSQIEWTPNHSKKGSLKRADRFFISLPIFHNKKNKHPYYNIIADKLEMPLLSQYKVSSQYYHDLFHEMIHSTGSRLRLNRMGVAKWLERNEYHYYYEEVLAEIGALLLCSHFGIRHNIANSIAYIRLYSYKHPKKNLKRKFTKYQIEKAYNEAAEAVRFIIQYNMIACGSL